MRLADGYLVRILHEAVKRRRLILAKSYQDHQQEIHGPIYEVYQVENELYHCEDVQYETFDALHMVFGK